MTRRYDLYHGTPEDLLRPAHLDFMDFFPAGQSETKTQIEANQQATDYDLLGPNARWPSAQRYGGQIVGPGKMREAAANAGHPLSIFGYLIEGALANETTATDVITAASRTGSTGNFTTATAHGLTVGNWAEIAGITPTEYNGEFPVTAVGSTTTFSVDLGAAVPGAYVSGGTVSMMQYSPDWYLRTNHVSAGSKLTSGFFGVGWRLMRIWLKAWHNLLITYSTSTYDIRTRDYDGILFDVMGRFPMSQRSPSGTQPDSDKPKCPVHNELGITAQEWMNWGRDLLAHVRSALISIDEDDPYLTAANFVDDGPAYWGTSAEGDETQFVGAPTSVLLDVVDLGHMESALRSPTGSATGWPTETQWKAQIKAMVECDANNHPLIVQTKFWPGSGWTPALAKQWHKFAVATFFMGTTKGIHRLDWREDSPDNSQTASTHKGTWNTSTNYAVGSFVDYPFPNPPPGHPAMVEVWKAKLASGPSNGGAVVPTEGATWTKRGRVKQFAARYYGDGDLWWARVKGPNGLRRATDIWTLSDWNLATPPAKQTVAGKTYYLRNFYNGRVLCNPTTTAISSGDGITAPYACMDIDGTTYAAGAPIALGAHEGKILVKT